MKQQSTKISRRDFLSYAGATAGAFGLGLSSLSCASSLQTMASPSSKRPNIIYIVVDDLGYHDLGCQGGEDIPTPFIDTIATNGMRFTDGYVTCPVCAPSRAAMMTGMYQQRFGFEFNIRESMNDCGIPLNIPTIADYLKPQGYRTAALGKWHLGLKDKYSPDNRGFDEFYGFRGGCRNYSEINPPVSGDMAAYYQDLYRNDKVITESEYLTDALGREAVNFIEKQEKDPFFLYLAFNAVHLPLQAKKEYEDRFKDKIKNADRAMYAAMLCSLDDAIGRILEAIRDKGIENDTLIFFMGDNGGKKTIANNAPLRGYKSQMLEGGIRVPMMAQWKGVIVAGSEYNKPVISIDMTATALAVAGAKPEIDGVDLIPFITKPNDGDPHEALFWRNGNVWAVRKGDWKAVGRTDSGEITLCNIAEYIREKDISDKYPEKVEEMVELYTEWNKGNVEPMWPRPWYQSVW